ncbi:MAG: DUF2029 domain-containing protein [Candidatus Methanoplasma sp.]|nr:DUF2029 domain-containing protein [Candidatus Methanoplasma sp.]
MGVFDNGIRRYQLILGSIFAAASIAYILVVNQAGIESEAAKVYFPYADELMRGVIPNVEYPPFAMVFMAIPRLFSADPFGYMVVFVAEAAVFFFVGLLIIGKLAKRYNQSQRKVMLVYTILMLLMIEFVLDRYDIFPAILTLLSLYCFVTKRYIWAFALLSLATMTKLYPAVLFPVYLIPFLMNRDWPNTLKGTGVFFVVAILTALPLLLAGSDALSYFISYHMDRPMQIESVAASFISVASMLGITDVHIGFGFGSDNLIGQWPDAVAPFLTPLIVAALAVFYVLYAYIISRIRREKQDNENNRMILLGAVAILSVSAFMIFGKVFSSQYIIWLIPFIIFALMTSIDYVHKNRIFWMSVAAIALTQLNFALNVGVSGGGEGITDAGMLIILARNIVMIILAAYIIKIVKESFCKRRNTALD